MPWRNRQLIFFLVKTTELTGFLCTEGNSSAQRQMCPPCCSVHWRFSWCTDFFNFALRMLTQPCDSLSLSVFCELSAQAAPVKDAQIRGFCKQKLTFYDTTHYPSWQDICWTSPTSWNCWQIIWAIDGKATLLRQLKTIELLRSSHQYQFRLAKQLLES